MGKLLYAQSHSSVATLLAACVMGLIMVTSMVSDVSAACPSAETYVSCLAAARDINTAPSTRCCSAIAQVAAQDGGPACLCELARSGISEVSNQAAVRALIGKCNIANPTGYVCGKLSQNLFYKPFFKNIELFITRSAKNSLDLTNVLWWVKSLYV